MVKQEIRTIIENSRALGWVLEPDAKLIMTESGLDVPASVLTDSFETAEQFLKKLNGAPVVAKAVSPDIMHKTEHQAVVTGITTSDRLGMEMKRLMTLDGCRNVLVEQMVPGTELIIGAKNDYQFGPVIVLGIGGTSVEIYNDTAIRMAPLKPGDVLSMVNSLKGRPLITGYRGSSGVDMEVLTHLMVNFSYLMMDLEKKVASIDLNPVLCTTDRCVIADARIILEPPAGS